MYLIPRKRIPVKDSPSLSSIVKQITWIILNIPGVLRNNLNVTWLSCLKSPVFPPLKGLHDVHSTPVELDCSSQGTVSSGCSLCSHLAGEAACLLAGNKTLAITWQEESEGNRMPTDPRLTTTQESEPDRHASWAGPLVCSTLRSKRPEQRLEVNKAFYQTGLSTGLYFLW